jgi:enterobacteria phage integrase
MATMRYRFVQEYVDRHGRVRRYLRRKGQPSVPLPGLPGTIEFRLAYEAALAGERPCTDTSTPRRPAPGPGSLSAVVAAYFVSKDFTSDLSASSQRTYRRVLSPVVARDGHRVARELPVDKAEKIIHEIGATRPGMANLTKTAMKAVFDHAKIKPNPFAGMSGYQLGTRRTWTEDDLAQFEARWPLGTRERLAFAVLLYTGQRVGDAVKITMADIARGWISVVQEKTAEDDDDIQKIPVHAALLRAVKAVDGLSSDVWVLKHNGRPIKKQTLSDMIMRAAAAAGLPPSCKPHGLRKAMMRRLAEADCTVKQIQSISGHRSLREIQRYTERASRSALSRTAMDKLGDPGV